MLRHASSTLRNDKEIVMLAVSECGSMLRHASSTLKDDKEVVLAALKNDSSALEYAGEKMKDNKEVALVVISGVCPWCPDGPRRWVTQFCSKAILGDPEVA